MTSVAGEIETRPTWRERRRQRAVDATDADFVVTAHHRRREALLAYALIAPAFFVFVVFGFYPFARNFYLATLQNGAYPTLPSKFVGLSQFWSAILSPDFTASLESTALFVAIIVPLGVGFGLALALLAHRQLRGIAAFRTSFASTVASSIAVGAAVFGVFFNPTTGFLPWLGFNPTPPILSSPTWSLPAMALIQVWQFTGVAFIILMAGMQSLPDEVLEAALVDGASPMRRLFKVTIPLLAPSIYVTIVVATVGALQGFGQIDVLIGPAAAVTQHAQVLIYLVYNSITQASNYGLAACYSIVLFFITLVVTLIQLRLLRRRNG